MHIRRLLVGGALACAVLAPTAAAAGPQDDAPGTPGDKNCKGQTAAYLAQASKTQLGEPGIGNLAAFNDLSVKDVKAIIDQFCGA